jgi:hypothetical protein
MLQLPFLGRDQQEESINTLKIGEDMIM